jgi:glutamate formiminotransferase
VYLYEKSERGRHEADLPALRKGGFGGLIGSTLEPDFGPDHAHENLGVTVVGVRDFLIAVNADLATEEIEVARGLAKQIRSMRREGDTRFLGVRALGFSLASRNQVQVSMNLTLPDLTEVDPIIEWIADELSDLRIRLAGTELIGVIRAKDVSGATRLPIRDAQVVEIG